MRLLLSVVLLLGAPALAEDAPTPTRALKVGLSAQYLVSNPFEGTSSSAGTGLEATYEFLLTPQFALGINLGYHQYFGSNAVAQIVYGLVLKHYLFSPHFYLQYGLLQQILHERGHSGAAVAYDAGLMSGCDFTLGPLPLFVEGAFHISHLTFIDLAPQNQSYFELIAGTRIVW
jgi:hypothetical protein